MLQCRPSFPWAVDHAAHALGLHTKPLFPMLLTPLPCCLDIMVFIYLSLSLLLSEVPWEPGSTPSCSQVLGMMSFKPLAYLGFQAVRFSDAMSLLQEGPSPLCYLDDHPI